MWRLVVVAGLVACGHREPSPSPSPSPSPAPRDVAPPDAAVAPAVSGELDASPWSTADSPARSRVAMVYVRQIRGCYTRRLKEDPTLQGSVVLHFRLDDRGRVVEAHAAGVDDAVDHCIEDAMRSWQFDPPGPDEPRDLELTFNLAAN